MSFGQAIYGACSGSFIALVVLVLLRGRINRQVILIVGASGLTALWSASLIVPGFVTETATPLLDTLRLSAWLIVMVALVGLPTGPGRRGISWALFLAVALCAVVVGYDLEQLRGGNFDRGGLY